MLYLEIRKLVTNVAADFNEGCESKEQRDKNFKEMMEHTLYELKNYVSPVAVESYLISPKLISDLIDKQKRLNEKRKSKKGGNNE